MVIAIDGPAGAGKSTVARRLAVSLGFTFLNSGSFYRAVAYEALKRNLDTSSVDEMVRLAKNINIDYKNARIILNGEDVEDFLRTSEIDLAASKVSGVVEVRHAVNDKMKDAVKGMSIVCEGRDMTTVVFPDAECKVYLDAPIDVQVQRRYDQYAAEGKTIDYEELKRQIAMRDAADKNKAEGSLKIAEDALYIDTADLNVDQVCEKITEYLAKSERNI